MKVKLSMLRKHPKNPKLHNDELIKKSIEKFDYLENILVDENNVILAGHGRFEALQKLGKTEIEVIRVTGLTEKEKEEYLLISNQATMSVGFDFDKLDEFDREVLDFAGFAEFNVVKDEEDEDVVSNKEIMEDEISDDLKNECPKCGFCF